MRSKGEDAQGAPCRYPRILIHVHRRAAVCVVAADDLTGVPGATSRTHIPKRHHPRRPACNRRAMCVAIIGGSEAVMQIKNRPKSTGPQAPRRQPCRAALSACPGRVCAAKIASREQQRGAAGLLVRGMDDNGARRPADAGSLAVEGACSYGAGLLFEKGDIYGSAGKSSAGLGC